MIIFWEAKLTSRIKSFSIEILFIVLLHTHWILIEMNINKLIDLRDTYWFEQAQGLDSH